MGRRGFTLIEVLIVLFILGLLAALLTPIALRVRARAHDAAAMLVLREAVLAETAFALRAGRYAHDLAELGAVGFRPRAGVELRVLAGGRAYCLASRHPRGTRWFVASDRAGPHPSGAPACR